MTMRRTKIIATLGPAADSREMIERLMTRGANVFRLNFSHGDHSYHRTLIKRIRAIAARLDMPIAILQDIPGPKVRVGIIDGVMQLAAGDLLSIYHDTVNKDRKDFEITINHPEILQTLKPGDAVYFADGAIRTEVVKTEADHVVAKVLVGGKLASRKGVNFPVTDLRLDAITDKDRADIAFGIEHDVDYIALSFVRSAGDVTKAKELVKGAGSDIPVIAKIEKAEALDHLDQIVAAADGIMVARGDLGVELGVHKVPVVQKQIIKKAGLQGIPVITATQMLTSMISSPYPTRAEVSDIANAVLDGTDAVMLSDETAVGGFPAETVAVVDATIRETEAIYPWNRVLPEAAERREAIATAATSLAASSAADGIICFTNSGLSALKIARHRPKSRLIATTSNNKTFRRLAMVWGIEPFFVEFSHENSDRAISLFVKQARRAGLIGDDDVYIITIGHHSNLSGTTNQIQLMDRQSFDRMQAMLREL